MSANVVAIDGPAGSGKSTVAKAVASELGWSFLDTGAMYRAVTVAAHRYGVELSDAEAMGSLARTVEIETLPRVMINGHDIEDEIRSTATNVGVSVVAATPKVREALVERQREWAARQPVGTVVEGRDITTVVFPDARLKVFLTASLEERARRRNEEGEDSIARRDAADAGRVVSPLRQAEDAIVIDTTGRSVEDVVKEIVECLKSHTSN